MRSGLPGASDLRFPPEPRVRVGRHESHERSEQGVVNGLGYFGAEEHEDHHGRQEKEALQPQGVRTCRTSSRAINVVASSDMSILKFKFREP